MMENNPNHLLIKVVCKVADNSMSRTELNLL